MRGAVIPVGDLFGQPILHSRAGLVNPLQATAADLGDVLGHHLRDGVAQRFLLRGPRDPGALGSGEDIGHRGLTLSNRTVVQIRRVVQILGAPVGIHLDVEHPPRDCAALARG